jgi:hypothetical protein
MDTLGESLIRGKFGGPPAAGSVRFYPKPSVIVCTADPTKAVRTQTALTFHQLEELGHRSPVPSRARRGELRVEVAVG